MKTKPRILVTAVGAPPGLNVLRSLHEAGDCYLVAADSNADAPGLYQYTGLNAVLPLASENQLYIEELIKCIKKFQINVIIPCLEDEITVICKYKEVIISSGARVLLPDAGVVMRATDKAIMGKIALEFGVSCPNAVSIEPDIPFDSKISSLLELSRQTPPPWVIKPALGHGMRGVYVVNSFQEAINTLEKESVKVVVQEQIPGKQGSMHLVGLLYDRNGDVVRSFASRSTKTLYKSGGPATAGISIHAPELISETIQLIGNVGKWCGPLNVEWMLDPRDNSYKFIEVNPRMWGYGYLATASGQNFPRLIASLAIGESIGMFQTYREGVTLMRSTIDLTFESAPSICNL